MRRWPDDPADAAADGDLLDGAALDDLVTRARFGDAAPALRRLSDLLPQLQASADGEALLVALHGRALLLHRTGAAYDETVEACDLLERAARERGHRVWAAAACALRARSRLDAGRIDVAMADLSRVDLEQLDLALPGRAGSLLLDALAGAYMRLRLSDRVDDVRGRLEDAAPLLPPTRRAIHWAHWSAELAARAMEGVATGGQEPDRRLMDQAVAVALRLEDLGELPAQLRRTAAGVRALGAAYRGRPNESLRLLGEDAFGAPRDLPALERQVVTLAAVHAHALVGSLATARSLDEAAAAPPSALPHLVLEVCRARERLWLETHAGGDLVPVLHRLTDLLVLLGWQGMDLVTAAARQALEHQALRAESRTDPLTGVGNRRALDEELRHMLRFSPLPVSLVLVDIDDFKRVNDRFTHVVGDEVLRRVAAALTGQLREGDRLVRYGGDEFVALLPRTGDQEARFVARRMEQDIGGLPWADLADGLDVGVTTGCAALWSLSGRRPDKDAERLFRRADEALLAAKRRRAVADLPPAAPRAGRRAAGPPDDAPADLDTAQLAALVAPAAAPPAAAPPAAAPRSSRRASFEPPPVPADLLLPPLPDPLPPPGEQHARSRTGQHAAPRPLPPWQDPPRLPSWSDEPPARPLTEQGGQAPDPAGGATDGWSGFAPPPAAPLASSSPADPRTNGHDGGVRPRRRPPVVDLTRAEQNGRSPFG